MQNSSLQGRSAKGCWISAAHHSLRQHAMTATARRRRLRTYDAPTAAFADLRASGFYIRRLQGRPHMKRRLSDMHFSKNSLALSNSERSMGRIGCARTQQVLTFQSNTQEVLSRRAWFVFSPGCSRILRHLISFWHITGRKRTTNSRDPAARNMQLSDSER